MSSSLRFLRDFCGLGLLDRSPHLVAPFRPRAVVILYVLESQKFRQNKPRMTRALANPAVNDGVLRGVETKIINVNLPKFFNRFERSIISGRGFPRNALRRRNVPSAQNSLLGIFRHMSYFSLEFTRRTNIDQRLTSLALLQSLVVERANLVVRPAPGNRVVRRRIARHFSREISFFGDPLVAATICDSQVFVSEKSKHP